MSSIILAAPLTDADLTGRNVIRIDPGTGVPVDATVLLPSGTPVSRGYYSYGTRIADDPTGYDSIVERVMDAFAAVSPGTWTGVTSLQSLSTLGVKTGFGTDYVPANPVSIFWSHPNTTFDPTWLGFDAGAPTVTDAGGSFSPPHHMPRIWAYDLPIVVRHKPKRTSVQEESMSGRSEERSYGGKFRKWDLKFRIIPGPALYISDLQSTKTVGMIPGLSTADPNYCFETLWEWSDKRKPIRMVQDPADRTVFDEIVFMGKDFLSMVEAREKEAHESPPYFNLEFRANQYIEP